MISLSQIVSYTICPRLCYFRIKFGEKNFTESHAVREIYLSLRRGFDLEWARKRAMTINENFDLDVFNSAASKFVFSDLLHDFKPIDWDVTIKSDRLDVVVVIDEIVEFRKKTYPVLVSLKAPKEGVWFRDLMKIAVLSVISDYKSGLIYYAYSGELRKVDSNISLRRKALKLIERVKMIKNGFVPERRECRYCNFCSFVNECKVKPNTFASKFL